MKSVLERQRMPVGGFAEGERALPSREVLMMMRG
jgi:pyridoxal biosynthesis lyase PdxS